MIGLSLLRAAALVFSVKDGRPLEGDESRYDAIARAILDGRGIWHDGGPYVSRSPGWSVALAGIRAVLPTGARAVVAVQGLFDVGTILLAAWTAERVFGTRRAGLIAFALALVWPPFAREARAMQTEPLFTLLVAAMTALALALLLRPGVVRAAVTGVAGGLACLVRPNGIVPLAVVLAGGWLVNDRARRALPGFAVVGLALALTLAPWTVRNWEVFHAFVPLSSGGGEQFYQGTLTQTEGRFDHVVWTHLMDSTVAAERAKLARRPSPLETDHAFLEAGLTNWRSDPARQVRIALSRVGRLIFVPVQKRGLLVRAPFLLAILAVHGLAIAGAVAGARRGDEAGRLAPVLLAAVAVSVVASSVFYTNSRYFEPVRWYELVLAAGALAAFGARRAAAGFAEART